MSRNCKAPLSLGKRTRPFQVGEGIWTWPITFNVKLWPPPELFPSLFFGSPSLFSTLSLSLCLFSVTEAMGYVNELIVNSQCNYENIYTCVSGCRQPTHSQHTHQNTLGIKTMYIFSYYIILVFLSSFLNTSWTCKGKFWAKFSSKLMVKNVSNNILPLKIVQIINICVSV